ncbi:MAG: sigma-70 family RNA polymerase sigma factor [Firmicutes bacterium]|nr:sigma-70 family RNA polymerase sigma factor [Bacillota bacterium]
MEEKFKEYLPLVRNLASRYRGEHAEADDLFQVGCLGLLKALRSFAPERGVAFTTYAVPVIAGEIKMYLRGQGPLKYSRAQKMQAVRLKRLQEELGVSLGRQPTLGDLAQVSGLEREEVLMALEALRPPLSLDGEPVGRLMPAVCGEAEAVVDRVALCEMLAELPERERQILIYRFFRQRTQQEVAAALGISQVHVSRLERKILGDLKERLSS